MKHTISNTGIARFTVAVVCSALVTLFAGVTFAGERWTRVQASNGDEITSAFVIATNFGIPTIIEVAPGRHFLRNIFYFESLGRFDTGSLPLVTGKIIVVGAGADKTIIDGSRVNTRIFTVGTAGYLSLSRLTVTNGFALTSGMGGAVANFGGVLRVDRCELTANRSLTQGGALISFDGAVRISRTTIMNNVTDGRGGGLSIIGGTGVVRDSTISGNVVTGLGVSSGGGGLYVFRSEVAVTGSTISGNQSLNSDVSTRVFGGGILTDATLSLIDSAVFENTVGPINGKGGGISNWNTLKIRDSTVVNNSASAMGGGIHNDNAEADFALDGVTIAGNDVYDQIQDPAACDLGSGLCSGGGGLWTMSATARSVRSVLAHNTVNGAPSDCTGRLTTEGHNAFGTEEGCILERSDTLQGHSTHDQIRVNPRLGELEDNGDAGNAHLPLLKDSPLIDAGGRFPGHCNRFDQIGQHRVDGDRDGRIECDIGAIEYRPHRHNP